MNRMAQVAVAALAFGATLFSAVAAQEVTVSASAAGQWRRHSLVLLGTPETLQGFWGGGLVELKIGPVAVSGSAFRGKLDPQEAGGISRDGGEVQGLLRLEPLPWFGVESGIGVRAFSSAAGYQRWLIPIAGIRVAPELGTPALRGYVRADYVPSLNQPDLFAGQTTGQAKWSLGIAGEAGLIIASAPTGAIVTVAYRFERYDFPGGVSGRLEQVDELTLGVGFRFHRQERN